MTAIKKWVFATFILTFLVIIAGGIVRTTQSGMGCPDWPKCFGMWVPPTNAAQLPADFEKYLKVQDIDHSFNVYHTWIEYINRLLGALLGLFAVIQTGLLFFKKNKQRQAFNLSIAFLAGVILTGLFGAIVVKLNLAHISISIHLFFAILLVQIQLALYMSVSEKLYTQPADNKIRRAILILLLIIFVQSVFGTMVRMYVDDISNNLHFMQRETWLAEMPIAFLIHRTFSWVTLAAVFYTSWYCKKVAVLKNPLRKLIAIILMSVTAGVVLYYFNMPAFAQPLHLLLAAMAITQTMFILLFTNSSAHLLKQQAI